MQSDESDTANQFISKQFIVEKEILEPLFRYIPDRGTI